MGEPVGRITVSLDRFEEIVGTLHWSMEFTHASILDTGSRNTGDKVIPRWESSCRTLGGLWNERGAGVEIYVCKDEETVGRVAADVFRDRLRNVQEPVLGLATGSTPLGLYSNLQRMVEAGELDLKGAKGFALDEYVGLSREHPESYYQVIQRTVVEPLQLDPANVHVPDGLAEDLHAAGAAYGEAIREAGGIDIQVLGVGSNGHIGFNEPFSSFASVTRPIKLSSQTREDNSRFFDSLDEVPTHAVTQGLSTILKSRTALMLALGEGKAEAIAHLLEHPMGVLWPISSLQLHRDVVVVIDEAAASKLQHRDHFVFV